MEGRKQSVIVYVDGFNFYYGLKSKNWRKYYWLDMVKFAEKLLRPHQHLIEVRYFSAKPTDLNKESSFSLKTVSFSKNLISIGIV